MSEVYTILTPLPQLILKRSIPKKVQQIILKEGFNFSPITPRLYRKLVDVVKKHMSSDDKYTCPKCGDHVNCAKCPKCGALINLTKYSRNYDEIIQLLLDTLEGGAIFGTKIATPMPVSKLSRLNGILYSSVADEILQRLFNCLLLYGYVPKPFGRSLWFLAKGEPERIDINTLVLLEPEWDYYDKEIKYAEPAEADHLIHCLLLTWEKLSPIAKIDLLNEIFTNEKKQEFYNKSGRDNTLKKAEEIIKVRYGQDAHFIESDIPEVTNDSNEKEIHADHAPKISIQQSMKWFIQGWRDAYFREIHKATRKIKHVSEQRFIRAFQFFTDACRMSNPHRFVALTMPLETLFCITPREITFQLSSRIAWFLEPDDFIKREKVFSDVRDLYGTRSKIVHGTKYDTNKVDNTVEDVEDLNRRVFLKILSCDHISKMIFDKNQKSWEQYLGRLNLGMSRDGGKV